MRNVELQVRQLVVRVEVVVRLALAAHHPVHHGQQHRRSQVDQDRILLLQILPAGHRSTGEDKSEEIFDSLRDSDLEIIAELARTKLQLSDIYHLNVGDVVDIKQPKDAPIFLNISGRRWFDGRMGIYNKQMAVKIGETYIKA